MEMNARLSLEPRADLLRVMRGRVVEDDMELLVGIGPSDFFIKRKKSAAVCRVLKAWVTLPVATSRAA